MYSKYYESLQEETRAEIEEMLGDLTVPAASEDAPVVSNLAKEAPLPSPRDQARAWRQEFERGRARGSATSLARLEAKKAETAARLPERKRRNQRDLRERRRAELTVEITDVAATLADLDMPPPQADQAQVARETAALVAWLATDGPQQRQLRREDPHDIMATRTAFLATRDLCPTHTKLAAQFEAETGRPWNRHQAKRRVALLIGLEAPGGPWTGGNG